MRTFFFFFSFLFLNLVAEETPFIVFSPPKCGTHLAGLAIEKLTGKTAVYALTELGANDEEVIHFVESVTANHSFVVAHNFTRAQLKALIQRNYKVIFTLRDLRDHLISVFDWLGEGQWPWMRVSKIQNPKSRMEELITGEVFGWTAPTVILSRLFRLGAFPKRHYQIVRFEALVGPQGQGDKSIQIRELTELSLFLGVYLSEEQIEEISGQLFGNSTTFRFGQIGRWKSVLTPYHIRLFKEKHGMTLIDLGYEQSLNW